MSRVTNLVLCLQAVDDWVTRIDQVNRYFDGASKGLVSVDDPSLPRAWYGGTKFLEAGLYIGAYNHLDLQAFITHLRSIAWECPECVQLLVKEEEDERFRLVNVFEDAG